MTPRPRARPYRKTERARQEEETRRRITEAAVELHGTVGPANTRMTEVAKRAGVSRMTVYNHFPTEQDLFVACSTHWAARNPLPDPSDWESVPDPGERLIKALRSLYGYYRLNEAMLGKVFRDAPIMPALDGVMHDFWSLYIGKVVRGLCRDWSMEGGDGPALRAAVRLAVDFHTWRLLTSSGLSAVKAADLGGRMVLGAAKA